MNKVAALFVATNGVYFGLPDVEPWDVTRDARTYAGPYPVVAHPPCERWGRYWGGGPMLHGTPRQKKLGDDGGCFASALESVRRFGGVLEHPEASHAFAAHGLRRPQWREGWRRMGLTEWVCCVAQGNYGHRARKLTWLFYSGVVAPLALDYSIPQAMHRLDCGRLPHGLGRNDINPTRLRHGDNIATTAAFRDVLLDLARRAQPSARKAVSA